MSGVNRKPLEGEAALEHIRRFREARLLIARVNRMSAEEEERELEALDDAIVGTNHEELRALRAELTPANRSARESPWGGGG